MIQRLRNARLSSYFAVVLAASLAAFTGCGEPGLGTIPVSGKITVDGQPMEGVMVIFNAGEGGRAASGRTDAQGIYKLTTAVNGDGALPGSYKISVSKHEIEADDLPTITDPNNASQLDAVYKKADTRKAAPSHNLIADMYSNFNGSGLAAEVKAGAENKFDFEVKGNTKK